MVDQNDTAHRSAVPATPEEQKQNPPDERPAKVGPLQTDFGDTTIAETVVQKLAGVATREVPGVFAMGSAARRAFGGLTERIPGSRTNASGGVSVEKGERQTAIDLSIVVENGVSIVEVSKMIRRNVIHSVEQSTGLEVLEVNISVTDVHLPDDNDDEDTSTRDHLE